MKYLLDKYFSYHSEKPKGQGRHVPAPRVCMVISKTSREVPYFVILVDKLGPDLFAPTDKYCHCKQVCDVQCMPGTYLIER